MRMERSPPGKISLPSFKTILDETSAGRVQAPSESHFCVTTRAAPVSLSQFNTASSKTNKLDCHQEVPTTPQQRPTSAQQVYPSPASELPDDIEMSEESLWYEAAKTPRFKVDESTNQNSAESPQPEVTTPVAKEDTFT